MATYYVDSNGSGTNSGTLANPWLTLAAITGLAAGDTVNIKRGSLFRETLTPGTAGTSGSHITYQDYSTGAKPIIRGSNVVTGWSSATSGSSPYVGLYWSASVTTQPVMVFWNGQYIYQGSSATTLNNLEWWWAANVLYVRDDAGSSAPSQTVEATLRTYCVNNARAYTDFINIRCEHDNSAAWRITAANTTNTGCETVNNWAWISANTAPLTFSRCLFDLCWQSTTNPAVGISGTGGTNLFNYCMFRRASFYVFNPSATITLEIDNCTFIANTSCVFKCSSAATTAIKNSVMTGGPIGNDVYVIQSSVGTVNLSNSFIARSAEDGRSTAYMTGVTPGSGNLAARLAPAFTAETGVGLMSFVFDDSNYIQGLRIGNALRSVLGSSVGVTVAQVTGLAGANINSTPVTIGGVTESSLTGLNNLLAAGDEVASHSRSHYDLSQVNYITGFQYTGAGSAATVTITSTTLTTTVTGASDNLSIDLTTNNLGAVVTAITAGGKYTATRNAAVPAAVPGTYLTTISGVDCRTAPISLAADVTTNGVAYASEITGTMSDLTALTAYGGGAYAAKTIIWPLGNSNAAMIATATGAGFQSSRLAGFGGQLMNNLSIWSVGAQVGVYATNVVVKLDMESSGTNLGIDGSQLTNTFTVSSISHVSQATGATVRRGISSALFDGSGYLSRSSAITGLDYTGADWLVAVAVYPTTLSPAQQTIWWHATDANNYHRMWIDSSGAAHYEIYSGGSQVIHVYTDNSRVSANANTDLTVRQFNGKIQILWGTNSDRYANTIDTNAQVTTATTPANYSGTFYVACGYNYGGSAVNNLYTGYLDDFSMACWTVSNLYAQIEAACAAGAWEVWMSHPGDNDCADTFKLIADAMALHPLWTNGKLLLKTFGAATAYIKSHGTLSGDGLKLRWQQADGSNYMPAAGSPLIGAGANLGYSLDLAGKAVPNVSSYDIGAYEYYSSFTSSVSAIMQMLLATRAA